MLAALGLVSKCFGYGPLVVSHALYSHFSCKFFSQHVPIWEEELTLLVDLNRIPETKGLSLEQVELLYTNSTVLKSDSYRRQLIANNLHEGMTPLEKAVQEKLEILE